MFRVNSRFMRMRAARSVQLRFGLQPIFQGPVGLPAAFFPKFIRAELDFFMRRIKFVK